MTAEELALVEAIHADPRNDAPRLAYADWLGVNGQEAMAELIRLMCREPYFDLAHPDDPQVSHETYRVKYEDPERGGRACELLSACYPSERFPDVLTRFWSEYRRGLPVYEEELDDFALERDVRAEVSPLVRFRIDLRTSKLAKWLESPFLRYVDVLRYSPDEDWESEETGVITAEDLEALAAWPLLDRLEELGLCGRLAPEAMNLAIELERRVLMSFNQ